MSEILKAIGVVKFERLESGGFMVRYPVERRIVFGPGEEIKARELFQSVARAEKGYSSGFDPRGNGNEASAAPVWRLCQEEIPLGDFLELCIIDLEKLFLRIDAAEGKSEDKARLKERIKHAT